MARSGMERTSTLVSCASACRAATVAGSTFGSGAPAAGAPVWQAERTIAASPRQARGATDRGEAGRMKGAGDEHPNVPSANEGRKRKTHRCLRPQLLDL